jgi:hypothetical protein
MQLALFLVRRGLVLPGEIQRGQSSLQPPYSLSLAFTCPFGLSAARVRALGQVSILAG